MDTPLVTTRYKNHRFTVAIISHAVLLYFRFCLSFRDSALDSRKDMVGKPQKVGRSLLTTWRYNITTFLFNRPTQ
jgi:hypothetical protein